jgi:hypothetical protein
MKSLKRFFIKDSININNMGKNQNNNNTAAASNDLTGTDAQVSAPSPRNVTLKVDNEGNVIEDGAQGPGSTQSQGTSGQPSTPSPQPNPEQNQNTGDGLSLPEGSQIGDINTDELINNAQTEISAGDAEANARAEKAKLLTQAINSRYYFENINFANAETGEQIGGSRIRYVADPFGKTIYDYLNDETVNQHIGFKVPDDDPKDGSIVNKQITIYWKNPTF